MINTILTLYSSAYHALRSKDYYSAQSAKLYSPTTKLLPFQFAGTTSYTAISNINLINAFTGATVVDLYPKIETADVKASKFDSPAKKYVQYLGSSAFKASYAIPVGEYYITVVTNEATLYSDIFTVASDLLTSYKYMRIEFSNTKDLDDTEPICYQNSWKQIVYFDADIKGGGHLTVEEVEERDGYAITKMRSVYELRRFRVTIPESVYRALIRLPLHDTITIYGRDGQSYTAYNTKLTDPVWSGSGAFCRLTIEFMSEVATTKTTNLNMA